MKFKTTAENRKDIVKAMEEILEVKSIYVVGTLHFAEQLQLVSRQGALMALFVVVEN